MSGLAMNTVSTIIPCLRYRNAHAMIDWLCNAFGFEKHAIYTDGDTLHHAQLTFGNGMIMLGTASNENAWASAPCSRTKSAAAKPKVRA